MPQRCDIGQRKRPPRSISASATNMLEAESPLFEPLRTQGHRADRAQSVVGWATMMASDPVLEAGHPSLNLIIARAKGRSRSTDSPCDAAAWGGEVEEEVVVGAVLGARRHESLMMLPRGGEQEKCSGGEVWRGEGNTVGLAWKRATVLWALSR